MGDLRVTSELLERDQGHLPGLRLEGDLVFGNFEGVLQEPASLDPWRFCMPPAGLTALHALGLNVVSLANNHSLDMGEEAYRFTSAQLERIGVRVVEREGKGVFCRPRNRLVRVIGYSFDSPNDVNDLVAIHSSLASQGEDVLIVSAHMGTEGHQSHLISPGVEHFGSQARGDVVAFSRRCVDAGADLVLGHGPHAPRGLELYRDKLIVYSLGNFLFDYPGCDQQLSSPAFALSIALNDQGDFRSARIRSYILQNGIPVPDAKEQAYVLIRNLTRDNLRNRTLGFPGGGRVERRE